MLHLTEWLKLTIYLNCWLKLVMSHGVAEQGSGEELHNSFEVQIAKVNRRLKIK